MCLSAIRSRRNSRRQLGFDVDIAEGKFQVPIDRWEALRDSVNALLNARKGRVHARIIDCEADMHGDVNAPILGSRDPVVYKASLCSSQLYGVAQLLR